MSSIRNSRTRLLTAAATVALATLSLTACGDGMGVADAGASVGASSVTTESKESKESKESTDSAKSAESTSGSSGSGSSSDDAKQAAVTSKPAAHAAASNTSAAHAAATKAPASKAPASSDKVVTCEGSNTKTVAAPLNRPVNHMLLTVTNTGSDTCYLYYYPAVRFGEAQAVPPVIEESQPQAVVTLEPGESGYASVNLSAADGSGAHGRTEKDLAVYFYGRSGSESVGKGARPSLPAKGVYIDDSLTVTYWQQSMDDAISW
ncbi:DUF4232 domain-containing protein [Streptomyces sp. NBC_01429]|uniref:DUF4232 domain-containing protein n=1 Tax=Streptomyces sp. NBC_01429 TaxID=2903862 RepID=UPI002E2E60E4|nr:DUF4232 domain-containing protein [Streptomyces sp. NBC_01429]